MSTKDGQQRAAQEAVPARDAALVQVGGVILGGGAWL